MKCLHHSICAEDGSVQAAVLDPISYFSLVSTNQHDITFDRSDRELCSLVKLVSRVAIDFSA